MRSFSVVFVLKVGRMTDRKSNMGKSVKGSMMPGALHVHTNWITFLGILPAFIESY